MNTDYRNDDNYYSEYDEYEEESPEARYQARCDAIRELLPYLKERGILKTTFGLKDDKFVLGENIESLELTPEQRTGVSAMIYELCEFVTPEDYDELKSGEWFEVDLLRSFEDFP